MHVSFKEYLCFRGFCSSLFVFQLSVPVYRGREAVKQKVDRRGQGEGGYLYFRGFCSSLFVFQLSVPMYRGREAVKQKVDRRGQGEGGWLKTGKNVRTTSVDDPLS